MAVHRTIDRRNLLSIRATKNNRKYIFRIHMARGSRAPRRLDRGGWLLSPVRASLRISRAAIVMIVKYIPVSRKARNCTRMSQAFIGAVRYHEMVRGGLGNLAHQVQLTREDSGDIVPNKAQNIKFL